VRELPVKKKQYRASDNSARDHRAHGICCRARWLGWPSDAHAPQNVTRGVGARDGWIVAAFADGAEWHIERIVARHAASGPSKYKLGYPVGDATAQRVARRLPCRSANSSNRGGNCVPFAEMRALSAVNASQGFLLKH
jgi:hypothetical protein